MPARLPRGLGAYARRTPCPDGPSSKYGSMISKSTLKLLHSLEQKKYRSQQQLFVAEGPKVVADLMATACPVQLIATTSWLHDHARGVAACTDTVVTEVTEEELRKASFLQHPQQVIGLFRMPAADEVPGAALAASGLCLALDGVQDPGNLGTIIRIADWFGIEHIICSADTADAYNPKVVQATMGSIARVHLHYTDLVAYLGSLPAGTPVYGTLLDGRNIYDDTLEQRGVIVMGNEGKGISPEVRRLVSHRLLIPNYPAGRATAESLNVAIATAITCAEFRRRQ